MPKIIFLFLSAKCHVAKYRVGQLSCRPTVASAKCRVDQPSCRPNVVSTKFHVDQMSQLSAKCRVGHLSVGQNFVCQLSRRQMSCRPNVGSANCRVVQMSCRPTVVSANCRVDQMSVDQMSVDQIVVDQMS